MSNTRRVLVLEKHDAVYPLLAQAKDLEVVLCRDADTAVEAVVAGEVDVGVIACDLGAIRGSEVVRRAVRAGSRAPLILACQPDDDCTREAALRAGAATCVDIDSGAQALGWAVRFAHGDPAAGGARTERVLQDLASFLAHEGKNALAGIGGAVQVIGDRMAEDSPERGICAEIQTRLNEFNTTLDTITFMLRAPRPLVRRRVDLRALIHEAAAQVPACAVVVSGGAVAIDGDPQQLRRLFASLFESAVGAASPAAPLRVRLRRDGDQCEVELCDAFPATDITRVRELFLTTVAQRVAEAHGGSLHLQSDVNGAGLRFTARLPIANGAGR